MRGGGHMCRRAHAALQLTPLLSLLLVQARERGSRSSSLLSHAAQCLYENRSVLVNLFLGVQGIHERIQGLGILVKLLHEATGHVVMVELKSSEVYQGSMVECEDNWNCQLQIITFTAMEKLKEKKNDSDRSSISNTPSDA